MYIIYKTTNSINGKIYVGYHETDNLNDDYLGSGKILKRAISKYGKEKFQKEILYVFPTRDEALLKEAEIVDEDFVKREDTYNYKLGGEGGWSHIPRLLKEDIEFKKKMYSKISKSMKTAHKEGRLRGWNNYKGPNGMLEKKHSLETRKKLSKNSGSKLSQQELEKRIKDYNEIDKTWGWVGNLAKKWNVSHTQVRRFVNNI